MAKSFRELLVDDFPKPEAEPPLAVLEELRGALAAKTASKLYFDIASSATSTRAVHKLQVTVQSLRYIAVLLQVSHEVNSFYPCRIAYTSPAIEVNDEEALRDALAKIVTNKRFTTEIGVLLAQA